MPTTSTAPVVLSLKEQLVREVSSMARRLATTGSRVPPGLIQAADQFDTALAQNQPIQMAALASTHERLARLAAPAKPGTLLLLDDNGQHAEQTSLGPVKLVRDLVKVAMVCVAIFIVLSVIALVDAHRAIDFYGVEGPEPAATAADNHTVMIIKIILERVFWLAAAGIGASFAMLFQLNDQIVNRTFDPDENASYWVKFFLGLVAGFILVALIPISDSDGAATGAQALGPPTIALLGGFSASAVYRILTRMVEALESIFSGGAREQSMAAEKAATVRASEESLQGRLAVAGQLVELQQKLAAGMAPDEAARSLKQVIGTLVPSVFDADAGPRAEDPPTAAAPPADKVQAMVVVSAPEEVVASADTDESEDESDPRSAQPAGSAEAVG